MKSKSLLTVILFFMFSMAWAQGFKISGTQLLDANGNNFVIKGVNVPLAWFVTDVNNNIAAIKSATGVNCLRIVVSTTTADNAWQTCVQKCIDNKIIPIVELHDVTGNNTPSELNRMAQFWASKAAYLTSPAIAKYILINIANEWSDWNMSANATGTISRVTWRDSYITAVKTMRDAGIKTTLICDAAGYGQDNKTQTLLAYAKAVQASDAYHNCLFSVHMYCEWSVGGNSNVATLLPGIKNAGIPIIVGEFGWEESNGNGGYCDIDESLIINTANTNGIGWIAWSWKGNGGVENVLDLSNDWAGTNLTAWGKTVTSGAGGTKTAITASVFTTTSTNTAPSVSITAPITNTTTSAPASITITANASDNDGTVSTVQFYNGTTLLNTDAAAPYTYTWANVAAGTYLITAKATDNSGASTISAAISVTVTATVPSNTGRALSDPNASPESKALYCYIQNLSGKKILSGQMWSGWGFDELAYIQSNTGKQPAIMGLDFIQESVNNTQVQLATNYWKKGGIPTIMWHWGAPGTGEGYPASQNSIDINKCFVAGTAEYTAFWAELKTKADHLQALRDAGIPVLWRPFHELNGGWFWWSKGNGTANETAANKAALFKKLWTTMYDYFVNTRQLNNLVWVLCYTGSPDAAWFPGNQYVDIAGGDEYASTNDPQLNLYNNVKKAVAPNLMPTTLHECGIPPNSDQCLSTGAMWSWFMEWHTSYIQGVDKTYLNTVYSHDLVITLDEVGSIMTACGNTACVPTPIVPYMQTDGTTWVQQSAVQVCAGSTVSLGPQPSVATGWTWTGPGNFTATTREITLTNMTVVQGGVYTATYKNAAGCSSTSQITVTVNALPSEPAVSALVTYCQGATATQLTATGTGLKWYAAASGGTALATAPTPLTTAVGTTNYYVSQTTNGCESIRALIAVTVNSLPIATIRTTTPTTFCTGGSVILTSSIGSSYKWMNGTTQVGTAVTYLANTSGNYTVEVTNANGCKATSAATTVILSAAQTASIIAPATSFCSEISILLTASTGASYKWFNGTTEVGTAATYTATAAGDYTVEVINNSGCKSISAVTTLTAGTATTSATITSSATSICPGSSVILSTSTGVSYKWFNGTIQVGSSSAYTVTEAGAYTVEVTNASGCKSTSTVTQISITSTVVWYADLDNDGIGDATNTLSSCTKPNGYVSTTGDACPSDANKITAGNCGCGNKETSCIDCAGVVNGTATLDVCNKCSGGTTGITPVTDESNCAISTGVVDLKSVDAIKILPNPSSEEFTLIVTQISSVQILTADGKLVDTFHDVSNLNFGSSYAKGVYVVQITTNKTTQVLRVIKL
jgi:hypothetical protein